MSTFTNFMDFSLTFVCFDFVYWNFSPSGTTVASPLYTNAGNVIVSPGCPTNVLSISAKMLNVTFI